MAPETSVSVEALLSKLTASLESTAGVLPTAADVVSPENGISLLEVKSELLVSYLQNLVFLILVKLKNAQEGNNAAAEDDGDEWKDLEKEGAEVDNTTNGTAADTNFRKSKSTLEEQAVEKLVELRLYLEKGVRPLENKLKYQIDKVLRAADTASRANIEDQSAKPRPRKGKRSSAVHGNAVDSDETSLVSGSGDGQDDSDASASASDIDELAYRPNPAAFARPNASVLATGQMAKAASEKTGVYRPPRITPMSMPTTDRTFDDAPVRAKRTERSHTLDEYISTELSATPIAEPSIGSTIVSGGRRSTTAREREKEAEKRAYEESNFIRLPNQSKKELKKRGISGRRVNEYGGEEMRGLGEGLDRIAKLTAKRRSGGRGDDAERGGGVSVKRRKTRR